MNSSPRKSRRIASNAAKKALEEAQRKEEERKQAEEKAKQHKKQQKRAEEMARQKMEHAVNTYQYQNMSYQQKIQFQRQQIASQASQKLQKFTVTNGMIHEAISSILDFDKGFDFSNSSKKSVQEIITDMATKVKSKPATTAHNPLYGNVMLSLAPVSEEEELKQNIKKTEASFHLSLQNWALHQK